MKAATPLPDDVTVLKYIQFEMKAFPLLIRTSPQWPAAWSPSLSRYAKMHKSCTVLMSRTVIQTLHRNLKS